MSGGSATYLLSYFGRWDLSEITIEAVDAYRRFKNSQADQRRAATGRGEPLKDNEGRLLRPLSATTINKTLEVLQNVLALAVEYGHIATNAAAPLEQTLRPVVENVVVAPEDARRREDVAPAKLLVGDEIARPLARLRLVGTDDLP